MIRRDGWWSEVADVALADVCPHCHDSLAGHRNWHDNELGEFFCSPACAAETAASSEVASTTDACHCQCGEWSGEMCEWSGPMSETVLVEWLPEHHRASHEAAGNSGNYPHNGARRIRVERSCAARMVEHDGEWCEVVDEVVDAS